jgi:ATP-grasp domain
MVRGDAELIVGTKHDELAGPVVMIGWGGLWVDVLKDIQLALAPITPEAGLGLLRRLRVWPVLAGGRGRRPIDVDQIARILSRLSRLAADADGRLLELDINPLVVGIPRRGAVAVDCHAVMGESDPR